MAKRRRNVAFRINDAGAAEFDIYTKPDSAGKQSVAETITVTHDAIPEAIANSFVMYGLASIASNRYQRLDDPQASEIKAVFDGLLKEIREGTWTPGRSFEEREPTDIELAVAEATGQPVDAVKKRFDEDIKRLPTGEPELDKRGRTMRIWTERAQRALADDPRVKPILARLTAERAKRLAAEAKQGTGTTSALDAFAPPVAQAAQ